MTLSPETRKEMEEIAEKASQSGAEKALAHRDQHDELRIGGGKCTVCGKDFPKPQADPRPKSSDEEFVNWLGGK